MSDTMQGKRDVERVFFCLVVVVVVVVVFVARALHRLVEFVQHLFYQARQFSLCFSFRRCRLTVAHMAKRFRQHGHHHATFVFTDQRFLQFQITVHHRFHTAAAAAATAAAATAGVVVVEVSQPGQAAGNGGVKRGVDASGAAKSQIQFFQDRQQRSKMRGRLNVAQDQWVDERHQIGQQLHPHLAVTVFFQQHRHTGQQLFTEPGRQVLLAVRLALFAAAAATTTVVVAASRTAVVAIKMPHPAQTGDGLLQEIHLQGGVLFVVVFVVLSVLLHQIGQLGGHVAHTCDVGAVPERIHHVGNVGRCAFHSIHDV